MYKKVRCTCIAVVLSTRPIVIFDVLVAVASSDRKVPCYIPRKLPFKSEFTFNLLRDYSNSPTVTLMRTFLEWNS